MDFKTGMAITKTFDLLAQTFTDRIQGKPLDKVKRIKKAGQGYMISFEKWEKGFLAGGVFPDKRDGEALIADLDQALEIARRFAHVTGDLTVNVYVIDYSFSPVAYPRTHKCYPPGVKTQSDWNGPAIH